METLSPGIIFVPVNLTTIPLLNALPPAGVYVFLPIISLSIALQVMTSAIVGAGLPLLVRRLGGDPAVAASPAITTTVDITGLLIYFSIASYALSL